MIAQARELAHDVALRRATHSRMLGIGGGGAVTEPLIRAENLGKTFGGNGQIFVKPSVLIGSDRGANWGVQAGFKVLNF